MILRASVHLALGNVTEALELISKTYLTFPEDHLGTAEALIVEGSSRLALRQKQEALLNFTEALKKFENAYRGQNHPKIANARIRISRAYLENGDLEEALFHGMTVLNISRSLHSEQTNQIMVAAHYLLAEIHVKLAYSFCWD